MDTHNEAYVGIWTQTGVYTDAQAHTQMHKTK